MAVKQLMIAATLDPEQAVLFRDLGHQFRALPGASQKAISCYQKAVQLDANDKESGVGNKAFPLSCVAIVMKDVLISFLDDFAS